QVDDAERDRHHQQQREAELGPDALNEPPHGRKRYPTPRTVRMNSGSLGSRSSFSRRWRTCTSTLGGSRASARPQSASRSISRENTRPGLAASVRNSSNST